jgi:hypothetical protein
MRYQYRQVHEWNRIESKHMGTDCHINLMGKEKFVSIKSLELEKQTSILTS